MTTQQSEDNTQWEEMEERFDDLVLYEDGLFNTESGWRIKADPKKLKQFFRQEIEKARQEERVKLSDKMFDVANKYNDCADKLIQAKQETAREIVKMIDTTCCYANCHVDSNGIYSLMSQIKKEYGIE